MNEAETRAEHIDPALKAAGWGVVEGRLRARGSSGHSSNAGGAARGPLIDPTGRGGHAALGDSW
jgi:type I restriction enzyme, R subunit